jgi:uncharacterized protein
MRFDWDEAKAEVNFTNHGVSFEEASLAFLDKWAIEELDKKHSDIEERFTIIGLAEIRLLRVTYTIRIDNIGNEIVRIISAREAKGFEKEDYEQSRNQFDR